MQSFFILSFLHDLKGHEVFTEKGQTTSFDELRLVSLIDWMFYSPYIGLLVAFIISLSISIRKKWFWINSLLVFILGCLFKRLDFDGWNYLKNIFLAPGKFLDPHSAWYYLVNGLPMLLIGVLLFFSTWTNRFIDLKRAIINNKH